MPNKETVLIPVQTSDIPLIARLAETIWNQHYRSIISEGQISYMLDLMYSSTGLEQQFRDGQRFYLIKQNDFPIGFLSVSEKSKGNFFLHKFYLLQDNAGQGRGTEIFKQLLELTSPLEIRLTVNRSNFKSINFYFKNGFVIERTEVFDIGGGYVMDDFVMVWRPAKEKRSA